MDVGPRRETMATKKYSHAFCIAFEVESDDPKGATDQELLEALKLRTAYLTGVGRNEIQEACGVPYDTYEIKEEDDEREDSID